MEDEPQLILPVPDEGWMIPPEELVKLAKALADSVTWKRRTRPARPDPGGWFARHRYG